MQINTIIKYKTSQPGKEKKKTSRKNIHTLFFDTKCNFRKDFEGLALLNSQRRFTEKDFSFATRKFTEKAEPAELNRIQQIIKESLDEFRIKYPNTVYNMRIENLALYAVN